MITIEFTIPGPPIGKGTAKFARRGNFVATYKPKKTADYEETVSILAHSIMEGREPTENPFSLSLILYFPIPKYWSKKKKEDAKRGLLYPTVKPDGSNALKAIEDGMNNIVWVDDKQVVEYKVSKRYSENPCAVVKAQEICF